ncbi:DNA polymerase III subunit alpha [Sphingobacterium sp. ML3W]|uniref:DNA polymerase III subunit alpha n=1 Tax=Sphingobacterium sp. ML3W TaxID=1538644 RepID=UPI0004F931C3|nr:DNA polymerase III subunit alpha [Sphingobacterium sp. ML3W]AIM36808.1 DNA polymerase III subunit alpha [Sphingobacterium sp. ML3W]
MLLNLHSYFSLRHGTLSLDELLAGMLANGYDTAVLTDINNSTGSLDFIRKGQKKGVNILAGMEFRQDDTCCFIAIAQNERGFSEINAYRTQLNLEGTKVPLQAPEFKEVFIIYPLQRMGVFGLKDYEYIGIRPSERGKAMFMDKQQLSKAVILAPVTFRKADHTLHRQLRAIDHNLLISQLSEDQVAPIDEVFLPKAKLMSHYADLPQLLHNTHRLLAECRFQMDFEGVKNKATFTGNRYNDKQLLIKYTEDGFGHRYDKKDPIARQRIARELEIIEELNFSSYFLITDDICRYARHRDYHYVGRGSGANSAVAYCLGITDVDPIALKLPFERFLNPKRKSPPDFDVDFSWKERGDMYDYIFNRYQDGRTALMGAMSTFRSRSILRELGKVYGLPKGEIDRLVHQPEHMLNKNEVTNTILSVYNRMADFPNQRTIHASGVLISEQPLVNYCALDYPPKGLPTMQFDMYVAEDIGFEKFDILSQRGIGHIKDCREIVKINQGITIDTREPKRFFEDPKIAEQLRSANTIGCFYIESPAMRQLITKLKCDDYLTLVAASSIIRPGVASSGMMGAFIQRHNNPSQVVYPHPVFKEQLEETYGVMVYQEDVMKIGNAYGGLDMADADVLRRMMSGKYRNKDHLIKIEDKFFDHCKKQGYPEQTSREIWRQMESFAGYSFNKAHSASFAVESYQSLYLKTYFPLEFMVSVLNNYGGFYNRKVYVNEARVAGANICLPCVNRSEYLTIIQGRDIYLGFDGMQHFESKQAESIINERLHNGPYTSLPQFVKRTGIGLEQLILLIRVGALRSFGSGKKEMLWEAHLLLSKHAKTNPTAELFEVNSRKPVLPALESHIHEDYYDEMELIGFCVSGTLFDLARSDFRGDVQARELINHVGQTVRMVGDFVAEKFVKTKRRELMKFGTFLDSEGKFFDTVHFPPSLVQYPLLGAGIYLIEGKVVQEFGCPSLEVIRCAKMPLQPDPRSV